MKQTLTYQPHPFGSHACRLRVEGFPDVSTGQAGQSLGILTGWCLEWVGHPQLEGRREHLQALMATVIPYARQLLSGVPKAIGGEGDPVAIGPDSRGGHRMRLRSSEADTQPLELHLDDAELADLVRVLDQCRLDPRIQLPLPVPTPLPLAARELRHRVPLRRRLTAPMGGLAALAIAAGAGTLLPPPRPDGSPSRPALPATGKAPAARPPAEGRASTETRLQLLRGWLNARTPTRGTGPAPQTWQLAVNGRGEVVAATPVEGNDGQARPLLGLPSTPVASPEGGDTLLVRGVLTPSGFWELSPWNGW